MRPGFPFASWQVTVLRCVRPPPSLLATIGAWLVCQRLLGRWRTSRNGPMNKPELFSCFERMMLGLAVSDMVISTRMFVTPIFWSLPFDGPSPSCTAYGFFLIVGFSGPFYNAAMCLYFLVMICSRQKETRLSWRTECILHLIAIGFPLISAIVGLPLRVFNPESSDIACFAVEYPVGCTGNECIRGQFAPIYRYAVAVVPLLSIWAFLIWSNAYIYWHVRRLEQKTKRFTQAEQTQQLAVISSSIHSQQPNASPVAIQSVSKTRMVATQSILYVTVYFLCWIWSLTLTIAETADPEGFFAGKYFFLNVLESLFYPCQGLFNAFVYFRPGYMRIRSTAEGRELSRWQCMKLALFPQLRRNSGAQEVV
jgi:hypothetical protein